MTVFEVRGADGMAAIASQLAPFVSSIDLISLKGDLGSGKTTFAQALLRGLGVTEEVTSPTYALIHEFKSDKGQIFHCDFYRLEGRDGQFIGLDDILGFGIVVAEWLDHAVTPLPEDRLEILIEGAGETRTLTFTPHGHWQAKLARFANLRAFLSEADWDGASCTHMRGDASTKSFSRMSQAGETRVLVDWPNQPDGEPIRDGKDYSELVHLARDGRSFVAVGRFLREQAGLCSPKVFGTDLDRGFLLIEDFSDDVFQHLAPEGADVPSLYRLAVDGLLRLRAAPKLRELGGSNGHAFSPADYAPDVLQDEANLLLQWYPKLASGGEINDSASSSFQGLWAPHFHWLKTQDKQLVLRDYHSPNLILKHDGEGLAKLGVIDFQDALWGHPAYDLVSLLQDARIDIPAELEETLFDDYCRAAAEHTPAFNRDEFAKAYAILGAQRNTKILGVFARLHLRDHKTFYLPHIPRVRRYLRRNLDHPALGGLKLWYAEHIFAWDHDIFSDKIASENRGTSP